MARTSTRPAPPAPLPLDGPAITDFLTVRSDFSFEMKVLRELRRLEFQCAHAASYEDPLSGKLRTFDIRARRNGSNWTLGLVVECKGLSPTAPLLIHATPREERESFHTLVVRQARGGDNWLSSPLLNPSETYPVGQLVGRQTDQPMKTKEGNWSTSDAGTYDKWIQAVSGVPHHARTILGDSFGYGRALSVLPLLVVPDGTLWQAVYSRDGQLIGEPEAVSNAQLIIGHTWPIDGFTYPLSIAVSHLEICTLSGLDSRISYLLGASSPLSRATEYVRAS